MDDLAPNSPDTFILYQTEDGQTRIQVHVNEETVWLTQDQMSELFQKAKSTINEHIQNIFSEGELDSKKVMRKFGNPEFVGNLAKKTNFYNLDVIISVGYRVKSLRGTQFRIWATQRLREYILKGFALDDYRLKELGGGNYFDELLSRIRDIRSSEKVFWRKVLDIYATSIDYSPQSEISQEFFATVQNKMHWAAHGHTAAEIIHQRADAKQPNMGLTNWNAPSKSKASIKKSDVSIAKNYLNKTELDILNRLVNLYLEFAELQALNRKSMHMKDWVTKLDDFLRVSDRDILDHKGLISHEKALKAAQAEYDKYKKSIQNAPSEVEYHFEKAVKSIQNIKRKK